MKLKKTTCPICQNDKNFQILYKKNFKTSDLNIKIFSARRLPDKIHYQIVKCKNCGLVRSNPIADSSKLNQLYKLSKLNYSEEINNLIETYLLHLNPLLNQIKKEHNILEIGCGNGFVLNILHKKGYRCIYGVEPSIDAVKKANKFIQKKIVNEPLSSKIFSGKKFKLIYLFQTLDHIPNPNEFINTCYNLLSKHGFILVFNHNINSFSSKILKEKSPIIDIEHTHLYSPQTITKIFEKHNFHIIKVYSPKNIVSIKHLIWLMPISKKIKKTLFQSNNSIFKNRINIKLGNLCLIAQK